MIITKVQAQKVLDVIDKGLTQGVGRPIPGQMCVEAAVCYAFGEPHDDKPKCVDAVLSQVKIHLNDHNAWKRGKSKTGLNPKAARTHGLRRLGVIQLGSRDAIDSKLLVEHLMRFACQAVAAAIKSDPKATKEDKAAAKHLTKIETRRGLKEAEAILRHLRDRAFEREDNPEWEDRLAKLISGKEYLSLNINPSVSCEASAAGYFIEACLTDKCGQTEIMAFCEKVVQALKKMKVPGAKWLKLTES